MLQKSFAGAIFFTLICCSFSSKAALDENDLLSMGLDEKKIRFFCNPTYWTPHCPMVCRLFPQFCQPEVTTTITPPDEFCISSCTGRPDGDYPTPGGGCSQFVTCTEGQATENSCGVSWFNPSTSTCVDPGFVDCYNCDATPTTTLTPTTTVSCIYIYGVDHGPPLYTVSCVTCNGVEECCPDGQVHERPPGCSEEDYSCYVCVPYQVPTTQAPTTTEVPSTTPPPTTTATTPYETCTDTCVNREDGIYPSVADFCRGFYWCRGGVMETNSCADQDQFFNVNTLKCEAGSMSVWCYQCEPGGPLTVPTTLAPPTTTTPPPTTTEPPSTTPHETCTDTCVNREDGLYPSNDGTCTSYYNCNGGVMEKSTCGTVGIDEKPFFNYNTMSCEASGANMLCYTCEPGGPLTVPTTLAPPTTTITAPTTPPPTTPPPTEFCISSCTGRPDGDYPYPTPGGDCSKYLTCASGESTLNSCSVLSWFDPATQSCVASASVECYNCDAPPTTTPLPTTTAPPETTTETTTPVVTPPAETTPVVTPPAETTPVVTPPAETTPAVTPPAETTTQPPNPGTYVPDCFSPFKCFEGETTFLNDPWDCKVFKWCVQGVHTPATANDCSFIPLATFDAEHAYCVWDTPCTDYCGNEEPPTATECPPVDNPPQDCNQPFSCAGAQNSFYPDIHNCHEYRRCQCGNEVQVYPQDCPRVGLTFDAISGKCVSAADCTSDCSAGKRNGKEYNGTYWSWW